jgi:fumarate reductase iron-sulfur subunit
MSDKTITLNVTRYRPGQDRSPTMRSYTIPYREDWVVLDALNHIKDQVDGTLSYRWSCRMGVCGSCGMMVNGTPKLTCAAFLRDYYPREVRVEPLANFPIIRDLVIDMSDFLDKLRSVKSWLVRKTEKPVSQGESLQTPKELDAYNQFTQCINCMLCYAACPVYGLEPEFLGPAAIALAYRYNMDSRDQGKEERKAVLGTHTGVWQCTFIGECSVVCPKEVDPAAAIQRTKLDTTLDWFKSVILPRGAQ